MRAPGLYELGVSTGYIFLTAFIAMTARFILNRISPENPTAKLLLLEAIAAWELCASCFELIIIADNWGIWAYGVYLFLLTIWWSSVWGDASACPYTYLEQIIEGTSDLMHALASTWAQLSGALIVFGYVQLLWELGYSKTHKGRANEDCTADLQVPAVWGALIELSATLLARLLSKIIGSVKLKYGTMTDAFIGTSLVLAAFNFSGGYFNPVLATSLKFGCKGHTNAQHLFVYWLGPSLGAILSVYFFRFDFVQNFVKKVKRE